MSKPPSNTDLTTLPASKPKEIVAEKATAEEAKSALKENDAGGNGDRNALLQDLLSKRLPGNSGRRRSAIV